MEFWIKQILTVVAYIGILMFSILNFSIETNRVLTPILTTVFVWVMNKTFSIDYQTKNEKELKEYQKKIDEEMEDYKNEWNQKLEDYKNKLDAELETHKAKLAGYTLVTKLQYELEFSIYKEIYGELMLIMSKIGKLSELVSKGENNQLNTEKENWKKEKEKIDLKILQNQPFYSKDIANQITVIVGTFDAIVENIENINDANLTKNFTSVVMTTVKEIQNLATLIRERIEKMKIVE